MQKSNWVLIKKVYGQVQAELLRGLLEAQGIEVLLSKEGAAKAIGLDTGAMGDTQLHVRADNEAAARELIRLYDQGKLSD